MREFLLRTYTEDEAETCKKCNLVEVVRCKNCKHWDDKGIGYCKRHDMKFTPLIMDNFFCSDGERKEQK